MSKNTWKKYRHTLVDFWTFGLSDLKELFNVLIFKTLIANTSLSFVVRL